jgi:hypothetical protein
MGCDAVSLGEQFSKFASIFKGQEVPFVWEPTGICAIVGGRRKPTHQPCGLILTGQNQSQKVKTRALKCIVRKGQNPEHPASQTPRLCTVLNAIYQHDVTQYTKYKAL